jgi:type VI secretion system secreted protein Hcp
MNLKVGKVQMAALAVGVSLLAVIAFTSIGIAKQPTTLTQSDSEWMTLKMQEAFAATSGVFMEYPEIKGESVAIGYEGKIGITSIQFASMRAISMGSELAGSSREASSPSLSEVTITKSSDRTTPLLFSESLVGESRATAATIFFTNSDQNGSTRTYMTIRLFSPIISSFSVSSSGELPTESISINYEKIELSWFPMNDDGTAGEPIVKTYDLTAQKLG